jgi:hypothetical protein
METAGLKGWEGWNLERVRELERSAFGELESGEVYLRGNLYVVVGRASGVIEN